MNRLPEEYCIINATSDQIGEVCEKYYRERIEYMKDWKIFNCSKKLNAYSDKSRDSNQYDEFEHLPAFTYEQWKKLYYQKQFVLPKKWCVVHHKEVADYIIKLERNNNGRYCEDLTLYSHFPKFNGKNYCSSTVEKEYTEITFEEFAQYVLQDKPKQTMKKEDFTIEGSEALKKAFVEESGLANSEIYFLDNLTSSTLKEKALTSTLVAHKVHFILPQDWDSALKYVKYYFQEELKINDYVKVLSDVSYNFGKSSGYEKPIVGNVYKVIRIPDNLIYLHSESGWITIGIEDVRLATLEEIELTKTKFFKLGNYKAKVTKEVVEVEEKGKLPSAECIKWFEKEFIVGDNYSSLGRFVVTENTYTINIGCIKNIPVKDIEEIYKYLKTL